MGSAKVRPSAPLRRRASGRRWHELETEKIAAAPKKDAKVAAKKDDKQRWQMWTGTRCHGGGGTDGSRYQLHNQNQHKRNQLQNQHKRDQQHHQNTHQHRQRDG